MGNSDAVTDVLHLPEQVNVRAAAVLLGHTHYNIHISVLLRGIYKNTQPWHSVVLNTNNPYIDLRQGANIWVRGFKPLVHGPLLAYNPLESGPKQGCQ